MTTLRWWGSPRRATQVLVTALLLGACGSADKIPAETAIKAAESAVEAVRTEAGKYAPEGLTSVENSLKAAKANFEKGEYKTALTGAQDVATKAKELGAAAAAKKADLTKSWDELSAGVPKMVEAIKSRVDILSQSKKLPAALTKEKFEGAKTGLAALNQTWTEASEAFKAGNLADAIAKATTVKDKAAEIMTALNMQVPTAAK